MVQSGPVIEALEPTHWLSATIELRLSAADNSGQLLPTLVRELARTMPAAKSELNRFVLGLDLRLADPADQVQRIAAYEVLDATLLSAGFEPHTLELVDWILAPSLRALSSPYSARQAGVGPFETRAQAVATLRQPLLTRYWSDARYGIANRRAFAAFHDGLDPLDALIVRELIENTTKTRGGRFGLRHVGVSGPYGPAQVNAAAQRLETDSWLAGIMPSKYDPNYLECARGPKARALSERDLISG